MPSNFPAGVDVFTTKVAHVNPNAAADVNALQDAVSAIETWLLGPGGPTGSTPKIQDLAIPLSSGTLLSFAETTDANVLIELYVRVTVVLLNVTLALAYTDASGAQSVQVMTARSLALGTYTLPPFTVNAKATTAITLTGLASLAGSFVSATFLGAK